MMETVLFRSVFRGLLVYTLVGCALVYSVVGAAQNVVTVGDPDEVERVSAQFQRQLAQALEHGELQRRKWRKLTWQGLECYEPSPVQRTLEQTKAGIRGALGDRRLGALQTYADDKLASIGRMPPTMLITQPGVFPGRTKRVLGVRTDQADSSWDELRNFITSFMASARLAVDLSVASEPDGAQVQLQAGEGGSAPLSIDTTCQLRNVWRGLYRMTVGKTGYKSAVLDLDLVNQGALSVSCVLAKAGDGESSRCAQGPMK
jgi:hypothetical protein